MRQSVDSSGTGLQWPEARWALVALKDTSSESDLHSARLASCGDGAQEIKAEEARRGSSQTLDGIVFSAFTHAKLNKLLHEFSIGFCPGCRAKVG